MATKERHEFIKGMVSGHRPSPPLMLPGRRALLWFAVAFVVSAAAMRFVQEFRPGFAGQLMDHPFFLTEVASALAFTLLGAYVALAHAIPGERVPKFAVTGLWILGVLLIAGLVAGFTPLAPESSSLGARHECYLQVFTFGAIALALFIGLLRRGFVRFSWGRGAVYGLVAGLVPASLMQLACLYSPAHGLMFHYMPAVLLIPIGLLFMKLLAKRASRG